MLEHVLCLQYLLKVGRANKTVALTLNTLQWKIIALQFSTNIHIMYIHTLKKKIIHAHMDYWYAVLMLVQNVRVFFLPYNKSGLLLEFYTLLLDLSISLLKLSIPLFLIRWHSTLATVTSNYKINVLTFCVCRSFCCLPIWIALSRSSVPCCCNLLSISWRWTLLSCTFSCSVFLSF